jgi:hypothetical protein
MNAPMGQVLQDLDSYHQNSKTPDAKSKVLNQFTSKLATKCYCVRHTEEPILGNMKNCFGIVTEGHLESGYGSKCPLEDFVVLLLLFICYEPDWWSKARQAFRTLPG